MVDSYLKLYEEYVRINDLYLSKQGAFETAPFVNNNDTLRVNFHQTNFELKKPLYSFGKEELKALLEKRKQSLKEYDFEKKKVIYGNNNDLNVVKRLTHEIEEINQHIDDVNIKLQKKKDAIQSKIDQLHNDRMKSILEKKQLFDIIQETNDDVIQKTKIDQYLDTNYTDNLLESEMLARKMVAIDDIVVRKHVIENGMAKNDVDDGQVVKKQNKANAKSKLEGKIKQKLKESKPKTEEQIKKEWKKNIMKGICGSIEDSKSTKHSKPYYMSKTQIHALIEKDPELKEKVGKMYKKLSRNDLCDKMML